MTVSKSRCRGLTIGIIAVLASVAELTAQATTPHRAWTLSAGGMVYRVGDPNGTSVGVEAGFGRTGKKGVGFRMELGAILNSDGFYDFAGLAADLGLTVDAVRGARFQLTLSGGPSALVGGDSDGTPRAAVGGHAAARVVAWISPRVGLYGRSIARVTSRQGVFMPGASLGLVVHP